MKDVEVTADRSSEGRVGGSADRESAEHLVEHGLQVLYQAARSRVRELAERVDPDLQPVGYGVLRYIMTHEPIRAGDIVGGLGIDKGAVSRQVTALRNMGLVEVVDDPEDRRASLLLSTDRARDAHAASRSETMRRYAAIFQRWSDDEIADFGRLLTKFTDAVD